MNAPSSRRKRKDELYSGERFFEVFLPSRWRALSPSKSPMTKAQEWRSLAGKLLEAGAQLFDSTDIVRTLQGARDPKIVALSLLARTIGNFEGALVMLDQNRIVEARALIRCCWENLFWSAALRVCPGTSSRITKFSEHEAD
jgi:hypothetical protein